MISNEMVAALEDFLAQDQEGELKQAIVTHLNELDEQLSREEQNMHHRKTFKAMEAARQAIQAGLLAMQLFEAKNKLSR